MFGAVTPRYFNHQQAQPQRSGDAKAKLFMQKILLGIDQKVSYSPSERRKKHRTSEFLGSKLSGILRTLEIVDFT